jgi:ketosteroid isomerase-like protein
MDRAVCFVTSFTAALMVAASIALAQSDPAGVVQHHVDAIARGDAAAALALYVDDAVVDVVSPGTLCSAASCVGKAAIQKEMERRVAAKGVATVLKIYASGNVATLRYELRNPATQKAGVERIIGWGIWEMKGDKIAYVHDGIIERADPQTARFLEWQRAQAPAR